MKSEKIRSKLAALLLILVLAASITACSGSKNTETGEDSTPSTEETVDTEAPEELESGQDIPEGVRETEEKPN